MWIHVIVLIGLNSLNAVGLCVTARSSAMMNVYVTRCSRKSSIVMCRCARTPFTSTDDGRTPGSWMRTSVCGWWFWKKNSKMSHVVYVTYWRIFNLNDSLFKKNSMKLSLSWVLTWTRLKCKVIRRYPSILKVKYKIKLVNKNVDYLCVLTWVIFLFNISVYCLIGIGF